MDTSLAQTAIAKALEAKWLEAKELNLQILKNSPNDTEALNRLAHAACELGDLASAKKIAQKVLDLDPSNTIAVRTLEKLNNLKKGDVNAVSTQITPDSFLEEPGKTKLVTLLFPGDAKVLAKLDAGDEVNLTVSAHRVSAIDSQGKYIGRLPDDMSARLRNFIKEGNKYQTLIKSVFEREVKVFIRELERSNSLKDVSSFPTEKIEYASFTPPELVHKDPMIREEIETTLEE